MMALLGRFRIPIEDIWDWLLVAGVVVVMLVVLFHLAFPMVPYDRD